MFGVFLAIISMLVTAFGGGLDPATDPDAFIENTETSTQIFVVGFIIMMIGLGLYAIGVRRRW